MERKGLIVKSEHLDLHPGRGAQRVWQRLER